MDSWRLPPIGSGRGLGTGDRYLRADPFANFARVESGPLWTEKDCASRFIILPRGQSPPALKEVGWDLEVGHVAQKVAVLRRKQMRPREKMPRAAGVGRPGGLGGPEQTARKSLPGGDLQAPRRASCRARARERRASSVQRSTPGLCRGWSSPWPKERRPRKVMCFGGGASVPRGPQSIPRVSAAHDGVDNGQCIRAPSAIFR